MPSRRGMADPSYACPCLNVRLYEKTSNGTESGVAVQDGWERVYVGEEGIEITHVDMTMRTRTVVHPPAGSSDQPKQQTVLTCLACRTPAYRTSSKLSFPLDEGVQEGPVVPSDDWIETEVLKSGDGWIEVNLSSPGCITGASMAQATKSARWSATFGLLIPESPPSTPSDKFVPSVTLNPVLPGLPPLFPPSPQIPDHPMFHHLLMLANRSSNEARQRAEAELSSLVKQRVEELQQLDLTLRREVELLWLSWKETREAASLSGMDADRHTDQDVMTNGAPLRSHVTDFEPPEESPSRERRSLQRDPSFSLLSMSLAQTSAMQSSRQATQPTEDKDSPFYTDHSEPTTPGADDDDDVKNAIPIAAMRELTGSSHLEDVALSLQLQKPMIRGRALSRNNLEQMEEPAFTAPERRAVRRGRVGVEEIAASYHIPNEERKTERRKSSLERKSRESQTPKSHSRVDENRHKHVTFDEKPETPPKSTDSKDRKPSRTMRREEQPIFDFDDDMPLRLPQIPSAKPEGYSPLVPGRPHIEASQSSLITARLNRPEVPTLPRLEHQESYFNRPQPIRTPTTSSTAEPPSTEIKLKELVAGDLPSHRTIWKAGRGWDTYSKNVDGSPLGDIEEDFDEDSRSSLTSPTSNGGTSRFPIAASAPIDISPIARRSRYSTLNYDIGLEPKTSLVERPGIMVPPLRAAQRKPSMGKPPEKPRKRSSSASRRNAAYARRDLHTHVDPGPIFELGGGVEDDDEFDGLTASEKARRMALEMQGTGDDLPDAGMWRSMAADS